MKKVLALLPLLLIILVQMTGCGDKQSAVPYSNEHYSINFDIPAGWELTEDKERGDALTLQMQDKVRESSFLTVTVTPASSLTQEEAVEEAEELLKKSLYALDDDTLAGRSVTLSSGEVLPAVAAVAGQREKVDALCVIYRGEEYQALITLIARQENFDIHRTELQVLLDSFQLN